MLKPSVKGCWGTVQNQHTADDLFFTEGKKVLPSVCEGVPSGRHPLLNQSDQIVSPWWDNLISRLLMWHYRKGTRLPMQNSFFSFKWNLHLMRKQSDIENKGYTQNNWPGLLKKSQYMKTKKRPRRHNNHIQFTHLDWGPELAISFGLALAHCSVLVFFSCLVFLLAILKGKTRLVSVGDGCVFPVINVGLFSLRASALSGSVNGSFVPGRGACPLAGFTCG